MSITDLPAIGQPLDGGTFAGLTTMPDGTQNPRLKSFEGSAVAVRYIKIGGGK